MARKLTAAQEKAAALDSKRVLQTTATKEVTVEHNGKTYTVAGAKISYGLIKNLKLESEAEFSQLFDKLWEKQVAKVEGLSEILDELDWEEWEALFAEWFSPISEGLDELEKKYA